MGTDVAIFEQRIVLIEIYRFLCRIVVLGISVAILGISVAILTWFCRFLCRIAVLGTDVAIFGISVAILWQRIVLGICLYRSDT